MSDTLVEDYFILSKYAISSHYHVTEENGVCLKPARACPNPRKIDILRTNFFREGSSHYFLQFMTFAAKSNDFFSNWAKTSFSALLGHKMESRHFFSKIGFRHF